MGSDDLTKTPAQQIIEGSTTYESKFGSALSQTDLNTLLSGFSQDTLNTVRGIAEEVITYYGSPADSAAKGAWDNLDQRRNGVPHYTYPSDLFEERRGKNTAHVLFDFIESVSKPSVKYNIAMYMPPTITATYATKYEEKELGLAKAIAQANTAMDWMAKGIQNGGLPGASASTKILETLGAGIVGGIGAAGGFNIRDSIELRTGELANPHMALLFRGVEFRRFQLDFWLMAKNATESDTIEKIIRTFKYAMLPSLGGFGGNSTYTYPYNVIISLFSAENNDKYLFRFGPCVIEDVTINYANEVTSFFEETGAPVDIKMSIKFKEVFLLNRNFVSEPSSGTSGGNW